MSNTFRPKRVALSAVNSPTVAQIKKASTLEKSEAESFLTEFIEASETNAGKTNGNLIPEAFSTTGISSSTEGSAILSQLRRVQRDLRGLPPLATETPIINSNENKKTKFDDDESNEGPKNKKIKFDDSESESGVAEKEKEESEAEENSENEKDKEEMKEEKEIAEQEVSNEEKKSKKEKKEKKDKKEKKEKKKSKSD